MTRTAVDEEETLLADMNEEMHALTEGITDINSKSLHRYTTPPPCQCIIMFLPTADLLEFLN